LQLEHLEDRLAPAAGQLGGLLASFSELVSVSVVSFASTSRGELSHGSDHEGQAEGRNRLGQSDQADGALSQPEISFSFAEGQTNVQISWTFHEGKTNFEFTFSFVETQTSFETSPTTSSPTPASPQVESSTPSPSVPLTSPSVSTMPNLPTLPAAAGTPAAAQANPSDSTLLTAVATQPTPVLTVSAAPAQSPQVFATVGVAGRTDTLTQAAPLGGALAPATFASTGTALLGGGNNSITPERQPAPGGGNQDEPEITSEPVAPARDSAVAVLRLEGADLATGFQPGAVKEVVEAIQTTVDAVSATFAGLPQDGDSAPGLSLWLLSAGAAGALAVTWLASHRAEQEATERRAGFAVEDWPTSTLPN
jgi:hypothetical protein